MSRIAAFGLVLVLAGCATESTTEPQETVLAGTYTLAAIGGQPLPWQEQQGTTVHKIGSGSITISATNSYTILVVEQYITNGVTTTENSTSTGTVARNGTTVTFTSSDATKPVKTGTIANNMITLGQGDGVLYVFAKPAS